ncbi:MAG: 30S ribosomal protein S9 [candidate division Zixibacteria bacterium]|nr:30S ribosomal protein S9 [candidate division Zixibacteria bacterium]
MAQAQSNPPSAIGRRKSSTARVILFPGKGNVSVNGRQISDYLSRETLVNHACEPLLATESTGRFDIVCTAKGGGVSGQAGAIRLALSRALILYRPDVQRTLSRGGFLTRDPREVERKKYGRPKARKRFQYSKR